jgi:hypothetical protein
MSSSIWSHTRRIAAGISLAFLALASRAEAQPTAAETVTIPYAPFITAASSRFRIPQPWIRAVICAESFGQLHVMSPKGAMGLMQLMPETWAGMKQRYRLGADPYDAHDNIVAGTAYLRALLDKYGAPAFLAAYNAGPVRLEDYLATGRALPEETRTYLTRLIAILDGSTPRGKVNVAAALSGAADGKPLQSGLSQASATEPAVNLPTPTFKQDLPQPTFRSPELFSSRPRTW